MNDTAATFDAIRTDVAYALRQLRTFRDVDRAIDALERVEALLDPNEGTIDLVPQGRDSVTA